jgi:hypothetical protein
VILFCRRGGSGGGGGIIPNEWPFFFSRSPPRAMGTIEFECVAALILIAVVLAFLELLSDTGEAAAETRILAVGAVSVDIAVAVAVVVSSLELEIKEEEDIIETTGCSLCFWA